MIDPIMDTLDIDRFYQSVTQVSFTLLGLWWVVVQMKFRGGAGDPRRRRHAYGVATFFLLPAVMSMISGVNSDHSTLWRVAFGSMALLGIAEIVLFLRSGGDRAAGPVALRAAGLVLYLLIAALALRPALATDLDLGMQPREVEAVLVALVVVVGANLAWFGLTEPDEAVARPGR